jgi:hypothetical protein
VERITSVACFSILQSPESLGAPALSMFQQPCSRNALLKASGMLTRQTSEPIQPDSRVFAAELGKTSGAKNMAAV